MEPAIQTQLKAIENYLESLRHRYINEGPNIAELADQVENLSRVVLHQEKQLAAILKKESQPEEENVEAITAKETIFSEEQLAKITEALNGLEPLETTLKPFVSINSPVPPSEEMIQLIQDTLEEIAEASSYHHEVGEVVPSIPMEVGLLTHEEDLLIAAETLAEIEAIHCAAPTNVTPLTAEETVVDSENFIDKTIREQEELIKYLEDQILSLKDELEESLKKHH